MLTVFGTACRREASTGGGDGGSSVAGGPARFAAPTNWVAQPAAGGKREGELAPFRLTNDFCVLQTELSPAVVVHSETPHLTLFSGLTNVGLSAPKFVAWATRNGPRTFQREEKLDVSVMAENWILVWWVGAEGWTNWDCPWVIYLQHKPDAMSLDADGLHMDFPKRAGDVVMMPLYGYEKLPLEGRDFREEHQLPKLKVPIKTWEWAKVIPRDPLTRVRYWGAATRDFPVRAEEILRIDGGRDELTIRSRFQRLSIADDWRSRRIKLAPVSPVWALTAKVGGFPVRFSERWFDLEMPTPFGPCFGVPDEDDYEVTLPLLQYISTGVEPAAMSERLRAWIESGGASQAQAVMAKFEDSVRRGAVDWPTLPMALPVAMALGRTNELAALRSLVGRIAAVGTGQSSSVSLEGLWAYVNFTGDTAAAKLLSPFVKSQFSGSGETGWAVPTRPVVSNHTASATRSLAFTRLAYLAGDQESYRRGCVAVARELAGLFIQERGSEYFHQHQPWHAMEVFPEHGGWLSELSRDGGWQFGSKLVSTNRWSDSPDAEVARFVRDVGASGRGTGDSQGRALSAVTDRMNSEPTGIWRAFLGFEGGVTNEISGGFKPAMPVTRLFPPGTLDEFAFGDASSGLAAVGGTVLVSVTAGKTGAVPSWPQLTWPRWRTPTGAAWTFGEIRPTRHGAPKTVRSSPLAGGNSMRFDYEFGAR